jgi:class 3 adenylate cyclase
MAEERVQRRLAAIVAADVVGYSRLIEQSEVGTLAALKERRRTILAPLVAHHQGRIVKVMGDGVLVEFASAVNAVTCAVELQTRMGEAKQRPAGGSSGRFARRHQSGRRRRRWRRSIWRRRQRCSKAAEHGRAG